MRKGFTLVELSIVLVIIGLLIGGILVAQSLIKSAELKRVIGEMESYKVLIKNFESRFKCLPGDCARAADLLGGTTVNGDGDGQVEYLAEMSRVWYQMSLSGVLEESYSAAWAPNGSEAGVNMPASIVDEDEVGWNFRYVDVRYNGVTVVTGSTVENRLMLGRERSISGAYFSDASSLHGKDALSIDKKFDDGLPLTGKIQGQRGYAAGYCFFPTTDAATYYLDYADDAYSCFMQFDLDW